MQRLFSSFPNALPGVGLLILRACAGFSLIGLWHVSFGFGDLEVLPLRCALMGVALALWVGIWTPAAAAADAAIQLGVMSLDHRYNGAAAIAAALGVALAMLGPGAWSIDAQLFGRKRIL
jgi:putative oxidoreductase